MKRITWLRIVSVVLIGALPTLAGIPEPDAIFFGQICLGNGTATDQSDVTVIARATVEGQIVEVGRYKMGDLPSASDCDGSADCYVLRVRLESVPANTSASGNAVVISPITTPMVQVFVVDGANPEVMVAEVAVSRALLQGMDLRTAPPSADLNGDGPSDLTDHQLFLVSFQGPAVESTPPCNPADLNSDGFVDLRDAAIMQRARGN